MHPRIRARRDPRVARFLLLAAVALAVGVSHASDEGPRLVKDINATFHFAASSSPTRVVESGGMGFFTADDGINGRELWRTDGTPSGTMLVKDIAIGSASMTAFSQQGPVDVNGIVYFTTNGITTGDELWRSDGTPGGTYMVADLSPGFSSTQISSLTAAGDGVVFVAHRPDTGTELWKSDGTAEGTTIVKDINPGAGSSSPIGLTMVNGTLFFSARRFETGWELWKSDRTEAGTVLVKDIIPGAGSSDPRSLTAVSNTLFFLASTPATGMELWKSDGTADGTVMVKDIREGPASTFLSALTAVGGVLFFSAALPESGDELWASDGTTDGTRLVSDIAPGPFSSSPREILDFNGRAWFTATTPSTGREIWMSDGTANGTGLVADLEPGPGSAVSNSPGVAIDDTVFFVGATGKVWKTDGTEEGTVFIKNASPGFFPLGLASVGTTLFFSDHTKSVGRELWASDGTSEGTRLVVDLNIGAGSSGATPLGSMGSTLYFHASDGVHFPFSGLWKTDGSESGTMQLALLYPAGGPNRPFSSGFIRIGTTFFFSAFEPSTGMELRKLDHQTGAVTLVNDINPGPASSSPLFLTASNGALYFAAFRSDTGTELWTSDGTEAGTRLVRDVWPGPRDGMGWPGPGLPGHAGFAVGVNGTVFFAGAHPDTGRELWKTDGTDAGTMLVRDINPGPANALLGRESEVAVAVGDTLFFRATDPSSGLELWKSDGTAAGTMLVKDIVPGAGGSFPVPHANVGGLLVFRASEAATGRELWRSDGTEAGTMMIQEIVPGPGSPPVLGDEFLIAGFLIAGDRVVFRADDGVHGTELWASDGFAVNLVADINPGPAASIPLPRPFGGSLSGTASGLVILSADDGLHGFEMWASDGHTVQLISNIAVGAASSFPGVSMAVGRNIFFRANDNRTGAELWAVARSSLRRAFNRGGADPGEENEQPMPTRFTADHLDVELSSEVEERQ